MVDRQSGKGDRPIHDVEDAKIRRAGCEAALDQESAGTRAQDGQVLVDHQLPAGKYQSGFRVASS
jgi:hypothetical protein